MSVPESRAWLAPPPLRAMRAAFIFFSRIPLGGFPYRPKDWQWASAHAPLVGLVLGVALGRLQCILLPLGSSSAAALVVGVSMLLTGAFHEDGLADTSDALGGGYDRERVLAILKDSRIGSFGGAALAVSIVARTTLLATLGGAASWAFPLAWCGARVGSIWLMATLPYVTETGTAKSRDLTRGGWPQAAVASGWFAIACAACLYERYCSPLRVLALGSALALVTALTGYRYFARVRGITGDFLGATEQLCELAAFAVLAWKV